MAYYASAIDHDRKVLGVGPFRRHGDALRAVRPFKDWARKHTREGVWAAYGTAHDRTSHKPGRFNEQVGIEVDADGWAVAA